MQQFKIPITVFALTLLACYLIAPHLQPRQKPTGTLYTSTSEGITESPLDARSRLYQDYPSIGSDAVAPTSTGPFWDSTCWTPVILLIAACFLAYAWTTKKRRPDEQGKDNRS